MDRTKYQEQFDVKQICSWTIWTRQIPCRGAWECRGKEIVTKKHNFLNLIPGTKIARNYKIWKHHTNIKGYYEEFFFWFSLKLFEPLIHFFVFKPTFSKIILSIIVSFQKVCLQTEEENMLEYKSKAVSLLNSLLLGGWEEIRPFTLFRPLIA